MAIEIVRRGGQNNPQSIQPSNQQPANFLTRSASALGTGLDTPTHLFNLIDSLLGGTPAPAQPFFQGLTQKSGYTPEQLAPQSKAEEIFQGGLEKIPSTLALGGGLPQTALGFLGSAGRVGAKEAGFGPIGQSVAEIGSEVLGSSAGRGLRPGKIRNDLRPKMDKLYQKAEETATPLGRQPASNLDSFIHKTHDELNKSGLEKSVRESLKSELENMASDVFKGEIKPLDAWNWKKHFNNLLKNEYSKSEPNKKLAALYKQTVGHLNEVLEQTGKSNPKFGTPYFLAEDIYKGLDAPNVIRRALEDNTTLKSIVGKNPTTKAMAALGSLWKLGVPTTVALGSVPFAARYVTRAYDLFNKSKTAQNLAIKIGKDIGNDSIKSAANSLLKLEREVSKLEKQFPESKKTKVEIVRRGK